MVAWPYMRVWGIQELPNIKRLAKLRSFYEVTHHDFLSTDYEGFPRTAGTGFLTERENIKSYQNDAGVPLSMRRPNCPVPIVKKIVSAFTRALVSERCQPTIETNDKETNRFLEAMFDQAKVWETLKEARDDAGAMGSSAIHLYYEDGIPQSERLTRTNLWVVRWRKRWIPSLVVEQSLIVKEVIKAGKLCQVEMWRTRAWDDEFLYEYKDVPKSFSDEKLHDDAVVSPEMMRKDGEDLDRGEIEIDRHEDGSPKIYEHRMGRCPIIWMQNERCTDCEDGKFDVDGALHLVDPLDRMQSKVVRATGSNVDPTAVYGDDDRYQKKNRVFKKGLGQLFRMGPQGKIDLLEIQGTSIELGWKSVHELRHEIEQTAGVVVLDPSSAGEYKSGVALQMLMENMAFAVLSKRIGISETIVEIAEAWLESIGNFTLKTDDAVGHPGDSDDDADRPGEVYLPPAWVADEEDESGELKPVSQSVGNGKNIVLTWPAFMPPSIQDIVQVISSVVQGTGQKQVISQETGVKIVAEYTGQKNPSAELEKIKKEAEERREAMFSEMGGPGIPGASAFGDKPNPFKEGGEGQGKDPKDAARQKAKAATGDDDGED